MAAISTTSGSLPELAAASPGAGSQPQAPTPFGRLVGALIASYGGAFITQIVPPNLLLALHLTHIAGAGAAAAFSLIVGFGGFCALVANPLGGRFSDRTVARFGRRRTWILTGGLGAGLTLFAMIFTTQVWQVGVIWCLVQTLVNFQFAAGAAAVVDQIPAEKRGSTSGAIGFIAAGAPVLGLVAVSAASGNLALQWAIVAATASAGAIVAVVLLRDPRHVPAGGPTPFGLLDLLKSFWLDPRRHPAFGWAWLVRFLITCTMASATYSTFLLIDRFGFTAKNVSPVILQLTLVSIVPIALGCFLFGYLSDRIRRQKPFVLGGGLVSAGGLVLLAFASTLAGVFVATGLLGIGCGMFLATDFALCLRVLPNAESVGKDFAVLNIASTLPATFVPFIAPGLLALGGFTAFYLVLAALGLAGAIAVLRIPEIGREGDPRFAPITRSDA
jgi:MFS family permease